MASGPVSRTDRPNTWLLRPALRRDRSLDNPEPSTHGPKLVVPDSFSGRLLMLLNERGGERQQHMSRAVAVLDHLTMAMNGMTFPSG